MIEILVCGYNIFCHLNNINQQLSRPKYPPEVHTICVYFEEQKVELPEYCKWTDLPNQVRKRNEF